MANILTQNDIRHVDYKDVDLLKDVRKPARPRDGEKEDRSYREATAHS